MNLCASLNHYYVAIALINVRISDHKAVLVQAC